jgi:hypothetical protein
MANRTSVVIHMTYAIFGLIIAEVFFGARASSAVVGSHQRYVALSLRRVASWAINVAFIAEGLIDLATDQTATATWYLLFGVFGIWLELKTHTNDDDWFNGRGTKIRRGIRRWLTASRPQSAPVSAPAFSVAG